MDAQSDKTAIELRLQRSTFLSYSELFVESRQFYLPHLHLAPQLGVTLFEFCPDLWHQKTRLPGLLCGAVCVILHLAV